LSGHAAGWQQGMSTTARSLSEHVRARATSHSHAPLEVMSGPGVFPASPPLHPSQPGVARPQGVHAVGLTGLVLSGLEQPLRLLSFSFAVVPLVSRRAA